MARGNKNYTHTQNAPQYLAWHVTEKGEKSYWNKVGAAWPHKDGKGFTLQLETCPINGRIVLRLPLDDATEEQTEGRTYPREPTRQSPSALLVFSLPTLFMGYVKFRAFSLMPRDHFGLAKIQHGKALLCARFGLFDELLNFTRHGLRNRRFDLLGGWKGFTFSKTRFEFFGLHPRIARERINLAAIIERDKPAPITSCQPEAALF